MANIKVYYILYIKLRDETDLGVHNRLKLKASNVPEFFRVKLNTQAVNVPDTDY